MNTRSIRRAISRRESDREKSLRDKEISLEDNGEEGWSKREERNREKNRGEEEKSEKEGSSQFEEDIRSKFFNDVSSFCKFFATKIGAGNARRCEYNCDSPRRELCYEIKSTAAFDLANNRET